MFNVSAEDFNTEKYRRFGKQNPEVMNCPFWNYMIECGITAWDARQRFAQPGEILEEPVWCFDRFGISKTKLPDGRLITIGGEHEDFYDDDFCIYNDVIVFHNQDDFTIYGYPKDLFPPTDFHSATLVDTDIYIIGGLGYQGKRSFNETPVYRLNTNSFDIYPVITQGDNPGWIHSHEALYLEEDGLIYISGGSLSTMRDEKEILAATIDDYVLDLRTGTWTKVTP